MGKDKEKELFQKRLGKVANNVIEIAKKVERQEQSNKKAIKEKK